MLAGDLFRRADATQVDGGVPRHQEPDMVADRLELGRGDVELGNRPEVRPDDRLVLVRQRRQVINERRERLANCRWGQMLTPVPRRRAAPGVVSARTRRPSVFPLWFSTRPGLPRPFTSAVTHVTVRNSGADAGQ